MTRQPNSGWLVSFGIASGLSLALALGAAAQTTPDSAGQRNEVRIVRLSLMSGPVEVSLPDGHGWRPALEGAPLVQGEEVRTLATGRTEIQLENGSTLRLIPQSDVTLARLDQDGKGQYTTAANLNAGTVFATLRKDDDKDFSLRLAGGEAITPDGDVSFRANEGQSLEVFDGKLAVTDRDRRVEVKKGEMLALGAGASLAATPDTAAPDSWTTWSRQRDQNYQAALNNGVQPGALSTYVNWYDVSSNGLGAPGYSGAQLVSMNSATCPWTVSSGSYAGWCWTSADGWFLPGSPLGPAAAAGYYGVSNPYAWAYNGAFDCGFLGPTSAFGFDSYFTNPFYASGFMTDFPIGGCGGLWIVPWFDAFQFPGNGGARLVPVTSPGSGPLRHPRIGIPRTRQPRLDHPVSPNRGLQAGIAARRLGPPPSRIRSASFRPAGGAGLRASHTSFGPVRGGVASSSFMRGVGAMSPTLAAPAASMGGNFSGAAHVSAGPASSGMRGGGSPGGGSHAVSSGGSAGGHIAH